MKRNLFVFLPATLMFTLVSCKKDYTCECSAYSYSSSEIYLNVSEKDAKSKCENLETSIHKEGEGIPGMNQVKCSIN